ncbi:hypothetical protein GV794_10095 [Nocardia cyriacigeorgica]|uniref:Uncharacterized protein n=2 Tax=Nocardia cyriacigeorgica TaxID=135487 RepID=A0A6P1CYG1_9NOCA|nr:hypothetical protein [Nocardia cyriacigeorgica]NEW39215.1 hypothetical protein [Nocardia cyriacigeorgica]NEW43145.1 hypothetical protein [Nocardia cyriacigeorgica]NEW49719.1 hypothetical protein [Nocardia cyriacigeorgica]NEW56000.1 hypothetical protein [Nocardia cyriacigeorgica]
MSYPTEPEPEIPWLAAGVSIAAPLVGGMFGPIGGAIGGLIGGATHGWVMNKIDGKSDTGALLTHAALGAIGGGLGGWLGRGLVRDAKWKLYGRANDVARKFGGDPDKIAKDLIKSGLGPTKFDEVLRQSTMTGVGYTITQGGWTVGRVAYRDNLIGLPVVSIGRG